MHTGDHYLQVIMPDNDILPIRSHSITPHILCPGLIEVIKFGECPDGLRAGRPATDDAKIETTVITFSKLLSDIAGADPGGVDQGR